MFENNGNINGFMYQGMQAPQPKFNNVLNAEEIKQLQQNSQQFSLSITQEEMLRAVCNHRNAEGTGDALVVNPATGEVQCAICGYKFRPVEADVSPEEIKEDVYRIQDILQTIKLLYIDLPGSAAKEFFPIIALLDKVPQLFDFAIKNMSKHENFNWQYNNQNMGAIKMFQNLQSMLGGMSMMQQPNMAMGGNGFAAAPNMGMGMGTPMMNPAMGGMNPAMGGNAFGYPGASANPAFNMSGYNPQGQGYQYVPGQQAAQTVAQPTSTPAAPATPAADTTVTQTVQA